MQFARADFLMLRRSCMQVYKTFSMISPSLCSCASPHPRYNKNVASNRTRLKTSSLTRHVLSREYVNEPLSSGDNIDLDRNFGHYNVRNILHQKSNDHLTRRINECASVDELFSLIKEQFEHMNTEHVSQMVLVLWDMQKIYNESYLQHLVSDDVVGSPESMYSKYLNKLIEHEDFRKVLYLLEVHYTDLSMSEMSCCLLYLKKMGVKRTEPIMLLLMDKCKEALRDASEGRRSIPELVDLTRITATVDPEDSFLYLTIGKPILPMALQYLDKCNSPEELRLLTFLLYNLQQYVVESILSRYRERVRHLLSIGVIDRNNYSILLQVAHFLTFPGWVRSCHQDVVHLCELVAPEIPNMDATHCNILHKVFQSHMEPGHMVRALHVRASEHMACMLSDERIGTCLRTPTTLYTCATHAALEQRAKLESILEEHASKLSSTTLLSVYKTLRHLKTANAKLCDLFWGKATQLLLREERDDFMLLLLCHNYLHFSSIGQIYRNMYFEKLTLDLLMKKFDEGLWTLFPKRFTRMCAFMLAFGYSNNSLHIKELEKIVLHLERIKHQISPIDSVLLSRGLQIASICMEKLYTSPVIAHMYHRVDVALTDQISKLCSRDLSLVELNCLMKCHTNKRTSLNADVTYEIIQKYATLPNRKAQLDSQTIRDIAHNFGSLRVIIPSMFEEMAAYMAAAGGRLLGDTAYRTITMFYSLGYSLTNSAALDVATQVIERDKEVMSSYSLLHACCALAYYCRLPESLVRHVFSIQFMERIDDEVKSCYQQWLYPKRLRRELMHLNRCVCIELPQHRVPWFHAKYLQEEIAKSRNRQSHLERSVLDTVRAELPDAIVRAPFYSPYGYKMALVTLDHDTSRSHKVGLLFLEKDNFSKQWNECSPSESQFSSVQTGPSHHRRHHLEVLGYNVLEVSASLWFSLHMTEPHARAEYLRTKILETKRS